MRVYGSTSLYGYTVGILVNDMHFPRLPGAIGNATTFPFPVLQRVVPGASSDRVVRDSSAVEDRLRAEFVSGAKRLVDEGAKAITTSCGFAILFQEEMAHAVNVPVFSSSLLLVPLLERMLATRHRVGILTADARAITPRHYRLAGIDSDRVALAGLENRPEFEAVVFNGRHELDTERMEREVVDAALSLTANHPDVGILLLECSLLPPFAHAIQRATGLAVFDFTSLVRIVHESLVRKPYDGYL